MAASSPGHDPEKPAQDLIRAEAGFPEDQCSIKASKGNRFGFKRLRSKKQTDRFQAT
jgi:hypothetical protein